MSGVPRAVGRVHGRTSYTSGTVWRRWHGEARTAGRAAVRAGEGAEEGGVRAQKEKTLEPSDCMTQEFAYIRSKFTRRPSQVPCAVTTTGS